MPYAPFLERRGAYVERLLGSRNAQLEADMQAELREGLMARVGVDVDVDVKNQRELDRLSRGIDDVDRKAKNAGLSFGKLTGSFHGWQSGVGRYQARDTGCLATVSKPQSRVRLA